MHSKDAPIPPGEEWYYELDDRTRGPLSQSDLEDLLNRSGETASEVRVRQGPNGPWHPFRSATPAPLPTAGLTSLPDSASSRWGGGALSRGFASSATSAERLLSFGGFWRAHWDVAAAASAWIALNVLFLLCWPQSYSRERGYLTTLRQIEADVSLLRAKPASDAEWREFGDRTRSTLAPIVDDLKKSASASEPVRQQLFWSARDILPRTLGPQTKEREEQDRRLERYLGTAERELGRM